MRSTLKIITRVSNEIRKSINGVRYSSVALTKPVKLLIVVDRKNWAYDSIASGLIKNKPAQWCNVGIDIHYLKHSQIRLEDISRHYDTIFFMGWQNLARIEEEKIIENYPSIPKSKIAVGIHSHHAWDMQNTLPNKSIKPPSCLVDYLNQFRAVNAVSERLYRLFVDAGMENLHLTNNGVDSSIFLPFATRDWSKKRQLVCGFSGNNMHDWRKGIQEIIEPATKNAFALLKKATPALEATLTLRDMPNFYRDLDLYLCASKSEGFSLSVLEAASCGIPIISTNVGGCDQLINHGLNGFIVDRKIPAFVEKIRYLAENPEVLAEMSENIRRDVEEKWAWDIRAPDWFKFLERAMPAIDVSA